jgi:hypothetical protein
VLTAKTQYNLTNAREYFEEHLCVGDWRGRMNGSWKPIRKLSGRQDTYAEKDIEAAILREMEAFILELGVGFAFLERQKRMQIGNKDYYLDLLFYHRKLRRLIAIDLKLEEFVAADKGQMELYLNWLKKHEQSADEAEPFGIILCAGKDAEHVELLELEKSGIHVASYLTKMLPKKQLELKLHEAMRLARARLDEIIKTAKTKSVTKQPRDKKA